MDTDKITGDVGSEIPAPPEVTEKPEATPREEVPLAKLEEIVAPIVAKAVAEATKEADNKIAQAERERRRNQSEADRYRHKAEQAERVTQQAMAQLTPEERQAMEAGLYREMSKAQPESQQIDARGIFGPIFEDRGVDPEDIGIDYSYLASAPDPREGMRRLDRMITQIQQKKTPEPPKPEAKPEPKAKPEAPPVEVMRPSGGGAPGRWTTEKLRSLTPKQKLEHADEIMKAFEAGAIEEE